MASFLKLLLLMLDNSSTNQQVFFLSEGPATIGALLQTVPPSCLTVQALTAIQQLTEQFSQHPEQRYGVYKHLLFNFKLWSRPSFTVRIGQSLNHLSHSHSSCYYMYIPFQFHRAHSVHFNDSQGPPGRM